VHCLNPCPKGWDFDPLQAHELGELAVNTGIWPLYEIENGVVKLYGKSKQIADGKFKRLPVKDYLEKQGRFNHFIDEDTEFFQSKVDEMWTTWLVPGIIPLRHEITA
jgi:pyruvate ferredoxin oxidoreductase beta subunit